MGGRGMEPRRRSQSHSRGVPPGQDRKGHGKGRRDPSVDRSKGGKGNVNRPPYETMTENSSRYEFRDYRFDRRPPSRDRGGSYGTAPPWSRSQAKGKGGEKGGGKGKGKNFGKW